MYNRTLAVASVVDNGASYSYSSGSMRQARNSSNNQVDAVFGLSENAISVNYSTRIDTAGISGSFGWIALGENVVGRTSFRSIVRAESSVAAFNTAYVFISKMPQLGYSYFAAIESGDGGTNCTFNIDGNATLNMQLWS
jgi:hypothetical protein